MMLLNRVEEKPERDPNPATSAAAAVTPMESSTARRPSLMLGGSLIVALAALIGAWAFSSATSTVPVMVLARDVVAGDLIEPGDLRVAETGSAVGIRTVAPADQALIVGRAARGPMPAGTVVNADLFTDRSTVVPPGMAVVGVELSPGAASGGALSPGDSVTVLGVAPSSLTLAADLEAEVLAQGQVWTLTRSDNAYNGSVVIGLLIPVQTQGRVAQAAADGLLRVTLVGAPS